MERHVGARAVGVGKSDGTAQRLVTAGKEAPKEYVRLLVFLGLVL
ncbi:hypothetical protein [Soonwooa sp.]|nr:hypothetical protein [Soonwooa sp.]